MYQKSRSGILKHLDFMILDILVIQISYMIADVLRHGKRFLYNDSAYREIALFMLLIDVCTVFFLASYKKILHRGILREAAMTIKHMTTVFLVTVAYMFIWRTSGIFSRIVFGGAWGISIGLSFLCRLVWKQVLRRRKSKESNKETMLLMVTEDNFDQTAEIALHRRYQDYRIQGAIVLGAKTGETRKAFGQRIEIVANEETCLEYLQTEQVDEILVNLSGDIPIPREMMDACLEMGITVHYALCQISEFQKGEEIIQKVAGYSVLTKTIREVDRCQMVLKRLMDILGSILGIFIAGIAILITAPIIKKQSPGKVLFKQKRVGRNGRIFHIYKIRSMYLDAEKKLAELAERNEMKGHMFKVENDPRVFPFGGIIRKTSIDELPQFWNVLKGDMSLVGTRPPTVEEYEQYDIHHKKRLAMKPGITGMWQVSGRNDIVDFEEVVRLDTDYLTHWNLGLDLKLIFKTIVVVLKRTGAS